MAVFGFPTTHFFRSWHDATACFLIWVHSLIVNIHSIYSLFLFFCCCLLVFWVLWWIIDRIIYQVSFYLDTISLFATLALNTIFPLIKNQGRLKLVSILTVFFFNPNVHVQKKISLWTEREREESQQAADNAIGTSASLCPGRRCQTALCTPRIPVPCQSVTSLTPYVAKYLCVSAWGGGSGY